MITNATDNTHTDTTDAEEEILEGLILEGLRQARQDAADAEAREARLAEQAEELGVPYSQSELASLSGAGEARHRRRKYALAIAALDHGGSFEGAAITLLAYTLGQGGGFMNPGEGTRRAVSPEVLTDWQNVLRDRGVLYGGGFCRRNAVGGDAWTAAAVAAAEIISPAIVNEWFHGCKWTLLERFRSTIVWERVWPASDAVRRMVLTELAKQAGAD
jgi:hypothetical protein